VYRATRQRNKKAANYVAKIIARYSESNYLVDLQYQQSPGQLKRQVFLCDDAILLQATFSSAIHPLGAEGYASPRPVWGPISSSFRLDVRKLGNRAVDFEGVLKSVPAETISFVHKNGPEWEGKYSIGRDSEYSFTVSEAVGCNVISTVARSPKAKEIDEWTVGWIKISDRWIVEHFTEKRTNDSQVTESLDLHYDSLKLETVPRPELFTIGALGLPLGARILDRRLDIGREFRIRYYDGEIPSNPAKVQPLTKQLEELPTRKQHFGQPQPLGP
jgi:hypothetical protein